MSFEVNFSFIFQLATLCGASYYLSATAKDLCQSLLHVGDVGGIGCVGPFGQGVLLLTLSATIKDNLNQLT